MARTQNIVLIADDDSIVVALIGRILRSACPECKVVTAATGHSCLDLIDTEHPDILILDVRLPDMDGHEICRRIKANERTSHITVLMITGGDTQTGKKIAALESGADAYLFKPFQNDELAAQIKVMLRIKQTEDSLRRQKDILEQAVREQTEELDQSRRALQDKVRILEDLLESKTKALIEKDNDASDRLLTMGIAHEINNPSTFIASNLQTFEQFWEHIKLGLDRSTTLTPEDRARLDFVVREMPGLIRGMKKGTERISSIIWHMKHYAGDIMANARLLSAAHLVQSTIELTRVQVQPNVSIVTDIPDGLPPIYGSEQMLCQVLVNLVSNAAHAMEESGKGGTITIRGRLEADVWIVLDVIDTGPGIQQKDLAKLFDPFFTTRRGKGGTGLGLFFSQGIIKGHRGSLSAGSIEGRGATFTIRLPVVETKSAKKKEAE